MTQNQVDEIKRNQAFNSLTKIKEEKEKLCDHRWPDGTSADDGGFMCGYFDL